MFNRDLKGGDAMFGLNDKGLYAWDPVKGLFLLARQGIKLKSPLASSGPPAASGT